jgi:selenocysteine-specific elongation factor
MDLPGGTTLGIVDVPGHERFLRNMIAGVGGLDLVLLLIDAVEGVKPQTVEHMEILQMLNLKSGIVLLTKADLVDDEWLRETEIEVREFLLGTFLENAPIIPISALTGLGLDRLRDDLLALAAKLPPRDVKGQCRLPVDRIFVRPGFGTVVTGSLLQGRIRQGDRLELLPKGLTVRLRSLQVHGTAVEEAEAGQRVGLNLSGLEASQIARGDVLAAPGYLRPTRILDGTFETLPDLKHPVKNRTPVRFYLDTAEIIGKLIILERDEMGPSEKGFVQLRLEEPVAAIRGDRFILRNFSALYTLGGGIIVEPLAKLHKRNDESVLQSYLDRESGKVEPVMGLLKSDGGKPLTASEIASRLQMPEKDVKARLQELQERGDLFFIPSTKAYVLESTIADRSKKLLQDLAQWHKEFPWRPGRRREEIFASFPGQENRVAEEVLARLVREGALEERRNLVFLSGHEPRLTPEQQKMKDRILKALRSAGFAPPSIDEIRSAEGLDPKTLKVVEENLIDMGEIVRVAPGLYLLTAKVEEAKDILKKIGARGEDLSPANLRDALGTSRKYIIPLLEHFDTIRFTRRIGDKRQII